MKYRVFDRTTKEDITNKYDWVITPDGKLHYNEYGDFIGYPNAMYINEVAVDDFKKTISALNNLKV